MLLGKTDASSMSRVFAAIKGMRASGKPLQVLSHSKRRQRSSSQSEDLCLITIFQPFRKNIGFKPWIP